MDPITAAIIAALATLSKDVIKDSYNALKGALKQKFGPDSDLVDAVDSLEKKPDSEGRKAMVQEEIEIAKAIDDPDLVGLAQMLLDKIKEQPGGQQVINQNQSNTVSGVNVGGNFEFKPTQRGGN
ncbi:MAG: hypothetical protein ACLFSH_12580 [Phormidium sp.]